MSVSIPITSSALSVAVTNTAADLATALVTTSAPGVFVSLYQANTDTWIAQGASPTASAGAGSMFVPARTQVYIDGINGAKLSVIRDSADGRASLTPVMWAR